MSSRDRLVAASAFVFAWAVSLAAPAQAAGIVSQPPCSSPSLGGACKTFDFNDTIPLIRGLRFTLPRAGSALVTFHGSLFCGASITIEGDKNDRVVDLVSQIVTTTTDVPTLAGPSALRHAVVFRLLGSNFDSVSDTFNLASTRVISYPTAGDKLVYFKIARLRMDETSSCSVYNATFSVVFTP